MKKLYTTKKYVVIRNEMDDGMVITVITHWVKNNRFYLKKYAKTGDCESEMITQWTHEEEAELFGL